MNSWQGWDPEYNDFWYDGQTMDKLGRPLSWKTLGFSYFIGALLLTSWLFPATRVLWDHLDQWALDYNRSLAVYPQWQVFWALANYRGTELTLILLTVLGYVIWIGRVAGEERRWRLLQSAFTLIALFLGALICKVVVANLLRWIGFARFSPTYVEEGLVHLSKACPSIPIKFGSSESFPGDHAVVSLLWSSLFIFFHGWKKGTFALLACLCWSLPRLAGATHWASDCLVGSLSIACFIAPLWIATPLYVSIMQILLGLSQKLSLPITSITPIRSDFDRLRIEEGNTNSAR